MARKPKRTAAKRKRPPRRKVRLKYPYPKGTGKGLTGALDAPDPGDSKELQALREAIDDHLVWPSTEAEDSGDYLAAVAHSGKLARNALGAST